MNGSRRKSVYHRALHGQESGTVAELESGGRRTGRQRMGGLCAVSAVAIVILSELAMVASATGGEVRFDSVPQTTGEGKAVKIAFSVSANTDVEIAVIDSTGKAVRHLAAGVLGKNAPAPLKRDSLVQSLVWDRKDDRGRPAKHGPFRARVRLGLKAEFDRIIGWEPEALALVKSVAVDRKGHVYVLEKDNGTHDSGASRITVLDRQGKYVRNFAPYSADVPEAKLALPGRLTLDGFRPMPVIHNAEKKLIYPSDFGFRQSMAVAADGRLFLTGSATHTKARPLLVLDAEGGVPAGRRSFGSIISSKGFRGHPHLALGPNDKMLYVSGLRGPGYYGKKPCDVIFRVATDDPKGAEKVFFGRPFVSGRDRKHLADPRGVATDAKGNVYVSDYGNNRVVMLNQKGEFLAEAAVKNPDALAVDPRTGAAYVLSLTTKPKRPLHPADWGMKEVVKLSSVKEGKVVWRLQVPGRLSQPVLGLDTHGKRPVLWVGNPQEPWWNGARSQLWRVVDHGDKYTRREVLPRSGTSLRCAGFLFASKTRDEVFVNEIGGAWRRFDGKTGKGVMLKLTGYDGHAGPDGNLYFTGGGRITRFDRDGKPVAFKSTGINHVTLVDSLPRRAAQGERVMGVGVSPAGRIHALHWRFLPFKKGDDASKRYRYKYAGKYSFPVVDVYDADGKLLRKGVISETIADAHSIRVDTAGNIYLAANSRLLSRVLPASFKGKVPDKYVGENWRWKRGFNAYPPAYGCLFKFPPAGGRLRPLLPGEEKGLAEPELQVTTVHGWRANWRYVAAKNVLWQHMGISPMPRQGSCVCTSRPRFDMDRFTRLFVPDAMRFSVQVLDSNGNFITRFGAYGNMDSAGPKSRIPKPEIAFAWPSTVAVSPKAVYVADMANRRITRVRMGYAVEQTCSIR